MRDDESQRPDPDDLLARVQTEQAAASRGRLEVYLGMCPGVGKTFAMLESAQQDRREGASMLVGIVETHGRAETEALLGGLDVLPRRRVEHRGVVLNEFDLDAALAASATVVLVDELAHTNAPGSRHAKRWQDVRELIEAGINVRTTLNIQHVESLNDVVAQITGVRMRETVPDAVVEQADEVILVDLPPDELIERLQAGKVYMGAQAARAADGFFRPANLVALRELALRFVASRVGRQVRFHRAAAGDASIWATSERLLVAVGPAPSSATLVRAAKRLATMLGAEWFAVFIETPRPMSLANRQRVSDHLRLAESLGAKTTTFSAATISEGILRFARRENVTKLVVGKPVQPRWKELLRPSPVDELIRRSGDIDVYVIRGGHEAAGTTGALSTGARASDARMVWVPIVATASAVVLGKLLDDFISLPDVAMLFLLASASVAFLGSRRAALASSVLGVLAFNFFFVPPLYTLHVAGVEYLITFAMLLVVTLVLSELSLRLYAGRALSQRSEARTAALYRLSTRLAEARGVAAVVDAAVDNLRANFGAPVAITLGQGDGEPLTRGESLSEKERAVVLWVLNNGRAAGRGTGTLASAQMLHLPLMGPRNCLGVVSIGGPALAPDQEELLRALARHLSLVLSVEHLDEERRRSANEAETERLRSSILSAVSHDLRTPLASILGSASSLRQQGDALDERTRRELLDTIAEEAERLNRLIANLLEMTRIEGGALRLNKVALPAEEVVGAALAAVRRILGDRTVTTHVPVDVPFVVADELLVQQVLVNLLENAAKHTAPGTPIDIHAAEERGFVRLTFADRGPGFAGLDAARLFERFYRGDHSATGAGLGLAICKALVEAHGGTIIARERDGGGAEFSFTLPIATDAAIADVTTEEASS